MATKAEKKSPANISFKGSRQQYDWATIGNEYIFGYQDPNTGEVLYETPQDIAVRHNLKLATVQRHIKKEQWDTQRSTYMAKLQRFNAEKLHELVSQDSVNFSVKLFNLANKLVRRADNLLDSEVTTQDIQALATSISSLQKTVASVFGETSPSEAVVISVDINHTDD